MSFKIQAKPFATQLSYLMNESHYNILWQDLLELTGARHLLVEYGNTHTTAIERLICLVRCCRNGVHI